MKKNQENCEHTRCDVLGRTNYEYRDSLAPYSVDLVHVRCRECGKHFGRDDWSTRRTISTDESMTTAGRGEG